MKAKNISVLRFGKLVAIKLSPPRKECKNQNAFWLCRCDCGNYVIVRSDNLCTGHTTKCGMCNKNRGIGSVYVGDDQ